MKLFLLYDPYRGYDYIEEVVNILCDCGHSPMKADWCLPRYNVNQWSEINKEKIIMAVIEQCDGVVVLDDYEETQSWIRWAKFLNLKIFTWKDVAQWEKEKEL